MMGYGWGMGAAGWIFMGLFWLAIAGVIIWAMTALRPAQAESPRQVLDRRFARGEIDVEQYRRTREELADDRAARR
jgi:putative membrane protein